MDVSFSNAKNGQLTVSINNMFLHSSYAPDKEAERFVNNIDINYTPPLITITEPGLGYIIPLLKIKYPNTKIAIIRFIDIFENYNYLADYVFNYYENENQFEELFFNSFGEELIIKSYFLQWSPSNRIFPNFTSHLTIGIKNLLEKSKTLLITREYFERKWLINTFNFIKYVKNPITIKNKIKCAVAIISSGPSLSHCFDLIKQKKDKLFIICLSSAIKSCLKYEIIPDLCISTDGGFWAGQHLKLLKKINIPLAIPVESFIPKSILTASDIIPLNYDDGLSSKIIKELKITSLKACRNGTVSGTALMLALNYCTGPIYYFGLDLSNQIGFQHVQPNELEINNSLNDNKLFSKEKRISKSQYTQGVLDIYKNWFQNLNLNKIKVFRIIDKKYKKNNLGNIKDISSEQFKNINFNNFPTKDVKFINFIFDNDIYKKQDKIKKLFTKKQWEENLFPLSTTSLTHNPNNADIINRISKDEKRLKIKIERIINGK